MAKVLSTRGSNRAMGKIPGSSGQSSKELTHLLATKDWTTYQTLNNTANSLIKIQGEFCF